MHTFITSTTYKRLGIFIFAMGTLVLSACQADAEYYEEDTHDIPQLNQFDVIDTYSTNSEFESDIDLAISPFVNAGQFEIFWDVYSNSDYYVEFRINDRPSIQGSKLISTELCGPYSFCDNHQYQFCDYSTDLSIRCETSSGDVQTEDISDFLTQIPQDAYFILQVCDTAFFYCEYETKHVSIE